jgi:hypothetical protein
MAEEAMVRVWEACAVKREALRRKVSSVGVIVPLEISSRVFSNSHIDLVDVLGHGGRPEVLLVGLGHVERELFVLVGVLMYCKWARERWEGERGGHVWLLAGEDLASVSRVLAWAAGSAVCSANKGAGQPFLGHGGHAGHGGRCTLGCRVRASGGEATHGTTRTNYTTVYQANLAVQRERERVGRRAGHAMYDR